MELAVYTTAVYEGAEIVLRYQGQEVARIHRDLFPEKPYTDCFSLKEIQEKLGEKGELTEWKFRASVWYQDNCLVSYQPESFLSLQRRHWSRSR